MWFMVSITVCCDNEMKNSYVHFVDKMQISFNGKVGGNI
jgi:hypothetical protein